MLLEDVEVGDVVGKQTESAGGKELIERDANDEYVTTCGAYKSLGIWFFHKTRALHCTCLPFD